MSEMDGETCEYMSTKALDSYFCKPPVPPLDPVIQSMSFDTKPNELFTNNISPCFTNCDPVRR